MDYMQLFYCASNSASSRIHISMLESVSLLFIYSDLTLRRTNFDDSGTFFPIGSIE